MAYAFGLGGDSGAGKGVFAAVATEAAQEKFGPNNVATIDQGAMYRMSALDALKAGSRTGQEVVQHALSRIEVEDLDHFLDRFNELWADPDKRKQLRTPEVGAVVAHIGKEEEAQVFYKDLLNLIIGREVSDGKQGLVIDSRTPEELVAQSVSNGNIEWAAKLYMHTPSEISACWAALKSGRPYAEHYRALRDRNEYDKQRDTYPNFEPPLSQRTDVTSLNHVAQLARARGGGLWIPDTHLYVRNDGTFPKPELLHAGKGLARVAFDQACGDIRRI